MTKNAQIVHISRFMPERIIRREDCVGPAGDSNEAFFKAPRERRFASPEYSSAALGIRAINNIIEDTGTKKSDIDLILYSCAITDQVNIGIGPALQYGSGLTNARVMQIDNGCVSFLTMLTLANSLIETGAHKKIVIVTVTNFISRLNDFQALEASRVLGDGASATLVTAGEQQMIMASLEETHGENYGLMICQRRSPTGEAQHYWEPNAGGIRVEFSPGMVQKLKENAFSLLPAAVKKCIASANFTPADISMLITHQPNMAAIEAWRDLIGIHEPRVYDTFHQFGNLFQSSLPVTISDAVEKKKIAKGDIIALGTFANGGDIAASMVLKW